MHKKEVDAVEKTAAEPACDHLTLCLQRRQFLAVGAAGAVAAGLAPSTGLAAAADFEAAGYPRLKLLSADSLKEGEPVAFNYPLQSQPNFIVKLGVAAQGGVGADRDIVAFSALCTHMGGSLRGRYRHDFKSVGPCPFHFSTFDLTKGGGPVHASATQNLPQISLEIVDGEIYAVGVNGLIYGYRNNLADGALAEGAEARRRFESNG